MLIPPNAFEPAGLTPHVEKYLADHVLRGSLMANETNDNRNTRTW